MYTFTEPREIILETKETENGVPVKTMRWIALNESVSEVRLEVPDEDAKDSERNSGSTTINSEKES